MERRGNSQTVIIVILAIALLVMSVGYAAFAKALNVSGTVAVEAAKWDIHFDTTSHSVTDGSVSSSAQQLTGTTASYTITLSEPDDFYEFSVKVVNAGTFDANLKSITLNGLDANQSKYITHTLTYNGTPYSQTNTSLSIPLVAANTDNTDDEATVVVKVAYVQPENPDHLPSAKQKLTLTAVLNYEQDE